MRHNVTVIDGLLSVEGGVTVGGVTIDMVTSVRDLCLAMASLCRSLEGTPAMEDPNIAGEYSQCMAMLAYLRSSKNFEAKETK